MTRRSKYGNKRVVYDGYVFDSKAELARYADLRLLEQAGHISGLTVHPRHTIHDAYTNADGKRRAKITYAPDFSYTEDDKLVFEDVKGVETAVFKSKRKLFEKRYNTVLRIVRA